MSTTEGQTNGRVAFPTVSSKPSHGSKSKKQSNEKLRDLGVSGSAPSETSKKRWLGLEPWVKDILVLSTVVKVVLFPAYRSTDFEVHRNWLAITHSLPISKWYYEATSEWTLDYPPFFAYFEYLLSIPASFIDSRIVDLNNLNYDGWPVIAFQRTSVILTELVMGFALLRFMRGTADPMTQRIISISLFMHPGFIIVDHIHFQYNAFMFGILLWSILMARNGNKLACGILFAVLLNFKHIYMYLAPAYFIYLLRSYCMSPGGAFLPKEFISLGVSVASVFGVSFGPFILMGQLPQVLSRLFPFTRGLNHAYWAPNAWALVTAGDRVLLQYVRRFGANIALNQSGVASTSRGLVGDTVFAVLPNIKPSHTFLVTVAFQSVALIKLWRVPTYKSFVAALTLCGFSSFMFGWHVHEKAILLVLVPMSLLAAENHAHFRIFVIASVAGVFSLFPLLFTPAENVVQILYTLLWCIMVFEPLSRRLYEFPRGFLKVLVDRLEMLYLMGFPLLQLFKSTYHLYTSRKSLVSTGCVGTSDRTGCVDQGSQGDGTPGLEFLPLMLTSVYCSVGLVWVFLKFFVLYLRTY